MLYLNLRYISCQSTLVLDNPDFIDLHQDMLSGVARPDGGFRAYESSFLAGPGVLPRWGPLSALASAT